MAEYKRKQCKVFILEMAVKMETVFYISYRILSSCAGSTYGCSLGRDDWHIWIYPIINANDFEFRC